VRAVAQFELRSGQMEALGCRLPLFSGECLSVHYEPTVMLDRGRQGVDTEVCLGIILSCWDFTGGRASEVLRTQLRSKCYSPYATVEQM
jgi:hypothetical protein